MRWVTCLRYRPGLCEWVRELTRQAPQKRRWSILKTCVGLCPQPDGTAFSTLLNPRDRNRSLPACATALVPHLQHPGWPGSELGDQDPPGFQGVSLVLHGRGNLAFRRLPVHELLHQGRPAEPAGVRYDRDAAGG